MPQDPSLNYICKESCFQMSSHSQVLGARKRTYEDHHSTHYSRLNFFFLFMDKETKIQRIHIIWSRLEKGISIQIDFPQKSLPFLSHGLSCEALWIACISQVELEIHKYGDCFCLFILACAIIILAFLQVNPSLPGLKPGELLLRICLKCSQLTLKH